MKILIENTTILPMTAPDHFYRGDIGIAEGIIQFIGTKDPSFVPDTIIDGSDHLSLPGLINAHTHLPMVLMRNYRDNLPSLDAWLNAIFPIEDTLSEEDILVASKLGVAELIQSGVTTFCDMYFHPLATAEAVLSGGIRANLGLTLFGDAEATSARIAERAEGMLALRDHPSGRISLSIAPHAIYTCSAETYQIANQWAREHDALLHTHLSETEEEVQGAQNEHGTTPLEYLISIGALQGVQALFAHGVFLSKQDIAYLAESEHAIVHNPSSNLKLNCGIAPVAKYRDAGIRVALGTDGAASNNNLNMVEEMHIAALLGRYQSNLSAYEVLKMATVDGAKALGLEQKIGTLEVGKEADLIMVNTKAAHLTPCNDPFSALVYSAQASDVKTVLCQGQLLLHEGKLLSVDLDAILRAVEKSWSDILARQ